jgi:hypothetical protein
MSLKYLSPIDLSQNEIQNATVQNLGAAPGAPVKGQFYFNTTANRLRVWNGTSWDPVGVGDGSVTSVSGSGGTTGLTLNGGPITEDGTLTLGGTLGIANGGTGNTTAVAALAALGGVASTLLGAASGVATLDSGGKVPTSQLPASVLGTLQYQGVWDASTNSPSLADGVGAKGNYYKVTTDGTALGITWTVGDLVIYNGSTWDQVQGGSSDVVSVAGKVGAVTLVKADVGLSNVANVDTTDANNISSGLLAVARGGTGAGSAAGAKANLGFTTKFATTFGDGTSTSFAINHGLGTPAVCVNFYDAGSGQVLMVDYTVSDAKVTFTLPVAPTTDQYRLVVVG